MIDYVYTKIPWSCVICIVLLFPMCVCVVCEWAPISTHTLLSSKKNSKKATRRRRRRGSVIIVGTLHYIISYIDR